MSLINYILKENTIRSNNTLLIVDVQPEYNFDFDLFAFLQYINGEAIEGKDIVYLYNGVETVDMISEDDLKHWLYEGSEYDPQMEELIYNDIQFYDKGYAFFRSCMDEGMEEDIIVKLVKFMWEEDKRDTRDLDRDQWIKFISSIKDTDDWTFILIETLRDHNEILYIPELMDQLEGLNNITMVGGGITECLREVEIALMALDKKYNINHEFTF